MPRLQQGAVVWANLPHPAGRRPVLILTRDAVIGQLNAITVAPLSRTIRNTPTEVILQPEEGVRLISAVSLDSIFTLPRADLDELITVLSRERMEQVFLAIRAAFDMG